MEFEGANSITPVGDARIRRHRAAGPDLRLPTLVRKEVLSKQASKDAPPSSSLEG
jgi:hypothetical protein